MNQRVVQFGSGSSPRRPAIIRVFVFAGSRLGSEIAYNQLDKAASYVLYGDSSHSLTIATEAQWNKAMEIMELAHLGKVAQQNQNWFCPRPTN
jgi:hypothetical protein